MVLTDTHTHQYYETDPVKRAEMMQRCLDAGVSRLFLPNVDVASIPLVFDLVEHYPQNCFPMLGLHPCDVKDDWQEQLDTIAAEIDRRKICAIGEIGLDLYWDKTTLPQQIEAFGIQLGWAKILNLPVSIHCRNAFDELYEVLRRQPRQSLTGIFHCFTGTFEQAEKIIALGLYLGMGGVITYKNGGLDHVAAKIDLQHIVLETDSPYLTPVPFRGKRNESAHLIYIAQKLADLHHTDLETVAAITTANSTAVFGL